MRLLGLGLPVAAIAAVSASPPHDSASVLHVGACRECTHPTLHSARDAIRRHRRAAGKGSGGGSPVRVLVHSGTYPPLVLDDPILDSHVAYEGIVDSPGADGDPPLISAGTAIPKAAWQAASAAAGLAAGVVVANITALGLSPGGPLPETGSTCCDGCDQETQLTAQLFHFEPDVVFQPNLARYPNAAGNNWQFLHSKGQATAADGKTPIGLVPAEADAARVAKWQMEEAAYIHGYYEWDWADGIMHLRSGAAAPANDSVLHWAPGVAQPSKPNARYFGLNLLAELDAPGEYHVSRATGLLHYLPAVPLESWTSDPVFSVNATAVELAPGVAGVNMSNVVVSHATSCGISGLGTENINLTAVTVRLHGARGVQLTGTGHTVRDSTITDVGCRGVEVHCGDLQTLAPGGCLVTGNFVTRMAQYKRTYQPGIHWGGVENVWSHNRVVDGPHNCFLGGGNEVGSFGGVGNIFEYNTLDNCAFEASDTGAFYSCGQGATAFVNPGNILRHSTFTNIRSTSTPGVQGITIQAIYLDDQMSSWDIYNNSFINCTTATFVGGGRLNSVHNNYYQDVDLAHHFDNRGMGWQKSSDVGCQGPDPCVPNGGCTCDPPAIDYVLGGPEGAAWRSRFPALVASHNDSNCLNDKDGGIPCYNMWSNNTYCRVKSLCDASAAQIASWFSEATNNTEVPC